MLFNHSITVSQSLPVSHYLSVSQSVSRSINQSVSQSVSQQSIIHSSIHPSIHSFIQAGRQEGRQARQAGSHSFIHSVSQSVSQSVYLLWWAESSLILTICFLYASSEASRFFIASLIWFLSSFACERLFLRYISFFAS